MIKELLDKVDLTKQPNKREKILIVSAITLSFIALLNYTVLPQFSAISEEHEKVTQLLVQKQTLEVLSKQPEQVAPQKLAFIGTKQDVFNASDDMFEPLFLRELIIESGQLSDLVNADISSLSAQIRVVGEFYDLLNYVKYLEQLRAPMVIDYLSLGQVKNNGNQLIMEIKGAFYGG